jgi:hypothetical protein
MTWCLSALVLVATVASAQDQVFLGVYVRRDGTGLRRLTRGTEGVR